MKKKKWIYIILLIVLIAPILFFYNGFNGNPLWGYFSTKALKTYLIDNYPDHEYQINDRVYNFKITGYTYQVIQIGDEEQTPYEFNVNGFLQPKVSYDGIYYANLDYPLMEKLAKEVEAELTEILQEIVNIVEIQVHLEVLQDKYSGDTVWNKDLDLDNPLQISLIVDVTNMSKKEIFEDVKLIQQTLKMENYQYSRVSFNGNLFDQSNQKDDPGYLKFAIGFDSASNITLDEIDEYNQ